MYCEECGKNPATVRVQTLRNGVQEEKRLCADCALKYGLMSFMPFSFGDLVPHAVLSEQDQIRCERCGMTLSDFKRGGLVGCQECYHYLRVGTEPILRRVQKGMAHTGRCPVGRAAATLPEHGVVNRPPSAPTDEYNVKLAELQTRMDAAIKAENFEEAATIRDEMRSVDAQRNAAK